MARDTHSIVKMSRREGYALHPKAHKALVKRSSPPGQQSRNNFRSKTSQYSLQLREKQKLRRIYRVLETQFHNYLLEAQRRPGVTGENLLQLLEIRFDNVIFRLGIGSSRAQSRQMISHRHFTINGRRVNIPSYHLKPGDVIGVHETMTKTGTIKEARDRVLSTKRGLPAWLDFNAQTLEGRVLAMPTLVDIKATGDVRDVREQLIIEFYSR